MRFDIGYIQARSSPKTTWRLCSEKVLMSVPWLGLAWTQPTSECARNVTYIDTSFLGSIFSWNCFVDVNDWFSVFSVNLDGHDKINRAKNFTLSTDPRWRWLIKTHKIRMKAFHHSTIKQRAHFRQRRLLQSNEQLHSKKNMKKEYCLSWKGVKLMTSLQSLPPPPHTHTPSPFFSSKEKGKSVWKTAMNTFLCMQLLKVDLNTSFLCNTSLTT